MNNLQQYSDLAASWWDESSPFKDLLYLNVPRFRFFDKYVSSWDGKVVLDLGCGGGFVSEELARRGAHVVGLDPSLALIEVAQKHAVMNNLRIDYNVGFGESLPYADCLFDVVVCVDVLEHVSDLDKVLNEVHRVLKPGGLFLFDTINKTLFSFLWMIVVLEWIVARIPRGTHDWRKFLPPRILNDKLQKVGFNLLETVGIVMQSFSFSKGKIVPRFRESTSQKSGLYAGVAVRL